MPKVRSSKSKPPEGWDIVAPTLTELDARMRDVESAPHEGKRKTESLWPILRLHHTRSRYVYSQYYQKRAISKELYDWLVENGYADANLIAKWKKPGYERLCCLTCIQTRSHNYGTVCICRVPRGELEAGRVIECQHCGCRGCATGDEDAYVTDFSAARAAAAAEAERRAKAKEEEAAARAQAHAQPSAGAASAHPAAGMTMHPQMQGFPFPYPMPGMPGMPPMPGMPGMPPMPGMPGMPPMPGMPSLPTGPDGAPATGFMPPPGWPMFPMMPPGAAPGPGGAPPPGAMWPFPMPMPGMPFPWPGMPMAAGGAPETSAPDAQTEDAQQDGGQPGGQATATEDVTTASNDASESKESKDTE